MKKTYLLIIFLLIAIFVSSTTINIPEDYPTIQQGINASLDGDEVIVSPGTYIENINFSGKAIVLGSLFHITQDERYISQTVIDGNQNGSVVTFMNGEDSTSVISGFTITNGLAELGGGVICRNNSSPFLEYLHISNNEAVDFGGGIYLMTNSNPIVRNVKVINNHSCNSGGGICSLSSNPTLLNVGIFFNSAGIMGGGIYCSQLHSLFSKIQVTGNTSTLGGGIYCCNISTPILKQVLITDNQADEKGGGIYLHYHSNAKFINSTLYNNSANWGGGIYCHHSYTEIVNCIIWNNYPSEIGFDWGFYPSSITVAYSNIKGGEEEINPQQDDEIYWLDGNIDEDPMLMCPQLGLYNLMQNSPCIDTGIAYLEYDDEILIDLSDDEYYGDAPDMGAYEYSGLPEDQNEIEPLKRGLNIYPNPFNPSTKISFNLLESGNTILEIYNIRGQKITTLANTFLEAGNHNFYWNAKSQASGVFFLRLKNPNFIETKKLILLK